MSLPPRNNSRPRCRAERARIRLHSISGTGALGAVVALLATVACKSDSTSPPVTDECSTGRATTMAVGAVTSPLTGTSLCASGGSGGAEYVLIPFNSSTESAKVSFEVTATGVGTVGPALSVLPGARGPAAAAQLGVNPGLGRNPAFEARLRAREAALAPLIPEARRRAALRARSSAASRAMIPSNIVVDQRLELNTNSGDACANPTYRIGRVVAVSNRSIVVADTTNPANGFTDQDYQSIAATFDNVVDPLMRANFGAPADIDGNGRVLLFFTRSVNELTPADNENSYVGGFFFGRDLFPAMEGTTNPYQVCPSSNNGEMFYLLVPDPTGLVNGNQRSTDFVRKIAVSIVTHEYQHLINASRRMYVSTTADDFEETWLNEGLSHIAEELLFFVEAQKQPRQDLNQQAFTSQAAVDAFNSHAGANFGRFDEFLSDPSANSPYGEDDSLATRGATWSFLRYAVDRKNSIDSDLWFRIVNSGKTGMANLQEVFGPDLTGVFRNWSTSVIADNLTGVAAQYQQASWNLRSIYAALQQPTYPLTTVSLTAGTPKNVQIVGGGSAYLRFAVPAGGAGEVTWGTTVPATMQMTLLRTR